MKEETAAPSTPTKDPSARKEYAILFSATKRPSVQTAEFTARRFRRRAVPKGQKSLREFL